MAKRVSQADGAAAVAMLDRERKSELARVWCVNDESNAVAVIGGEGYCATCMPFAYAKAVGAARGDAKFMKFQPLPANFAEENPS